MRKRSRYIFGFATLAVALLLIVVILASDTENAAAPQTLPDGSTIALTGTAIGTNAVFIHGTLWQKFLYHILPANGLRIAHYSLKPPGISVSQSFRERRLFMEFRHVKPPSQSKFEAGVGFDLFSIGNVPAANTRVVISCDGYDFINAFEAQPDSGYFYLRLAYFPRQSKVLNIRIEQRDSANPAWHAVARFTVHSKPEPEQSWTAEPFPIKRTAGDLQFIFSNVFVCSTNPPEEWYANQAESRLVYQVWRSGEIEFPSMISALDIRDSSGNHYAPNPADIKNDLHMPWATARMFQSLDPRKVWHVQMTVRNLRSDSPTSTLDFFVKPVQKY